MRMQAESAVLVIVDVQERLAPEMDDPRAAIYGAAHLVQMAGRLGVPVVLTEQRPESLGPTMIDVRQVLPEEAAVVAKTAFAATDAPAFAEALAARGAVQAVVAGVEAHVCVLQTALGLRDAGVQPFVVRDCCSARRPADADAAWARLTANGIDTVTREMVAHEWLRDATAPGWREITGSLS